MPTLVRAERSELVPGRIAFDAAPLRPRPSGVGIYVRDLATAIHRLRPDDIAFIGVRPDGDLAWLRGRARTTDFPGGHHVAWLQRRGAADARALGVGLVHFTNAVAPVRCPTPYVLTIQDLSLLRMPHLHPAARVALAPLMAWSAMRAVAVIVPSSATASDVRRWLRVPASRIAIVNHAPSSGIRPVHSDRVAEVRARLSLGERYVVSVGALEPRKNHVRLVSAFERLAIDDPSLRLVLVGERAWGAGAVERRIERSPARDRIVVTGYVPAPDLSAIVQGSLTLAYPSLFEGYGLPVAEAVALGVPVVTSDGSSLPEVAGERAILVDPRDVDDLARGLRAALARPRSDAVNGAGARTWEDVAAETLAVYEWAGRRRPAG